MLKIAVAVATADARPDAFVVWRGIEESARKAADFGYDGIELALRSAEQVEARAFAALLRAHGLACPCLSTGQVFAASGLYFTTEDPEKRTAVRRVFKGLIDLASELGALVNLGRARGFVAPGETRAQAIARFGEVAGEMAAYAQGRGVRLVLEPINRYESNFINSLAEGAALLDTLALPGLALMPDLFHMNIEDRSLGGELERHADQIAYLHLADSNRLAPGQGHTDFTAVFAALKRMRYQGWAAVEILPNPTPDRAARQALDYLRPLVEEHNRA